MQIVLNNKLYLQHNLKANKKMITANLLHGQENIKLISTIDISSIKFGNQNLKELEVLSVNVNQNEVLVSFWNNEHKTWMHCDWSVNDFNEKCEKYGYQYK